MAMLTRAEELKQLVWDKKLQTEIEECCKMVNSTTSASLVQHLERAYQRRLKFEVELEILKMKGQA